MDYLHINEPTVTVTNSRNYWTREIKLDWSANPFTQEEAHQTKPGPFQQLAYLALAKQALDDLFSSGLGFRVKIHIVWRVLIPAQGEEPVLYPMSFVPEFP